MTNKHKIILLSIAVVLMLCLMCYTITKPIEHTTKYAISHVDDYGKNLPHTYYNQSQPSIISRITNSNSTTQNFSTNKESSEKVNESSVIQYATEIGMTEVDYPNIALYQVADQCYQVYYGNTRINPLFPLALANVETPGRADHNITWSSLFPSRYVDISLLDTFNVCDIANDPERYGALMKERSTRDRGALQMSPTYGTKNDYFNSLMSGTEVDKLKESSWNPIASNWVRGASTMPGDRFCTRDVLYRLSAAGTSAITDMSKHGIGIGSDAEAIVMLAMYHHRSGVWAVDGAGGWKSGGKSVEYVKQITNQEQIDKLTEFYRNNPDKFNISSATAKQLLNFNYSDYTTSSIEAVYPLQVLYAYIVLVNLYGYQ